MMELILSTAGLTAIIAIICTPCILNDMKYTIRDIKEQQDNIVQILEQIKDSLDVIAAK
jgi:hypothetical protein